MNLSPSLPQITSLQSEHEEQEQTICQYEEELVQAREELLKLQEETRVLEEKVQAAREQLTPLQESVRDSFKQVTQVWSAPSHRYHWVAQFELIKLQPYWLQVKTPYPPG